MLLHIAHDTTYRYDAPLRFSTQYLRLSPRPTPGLVVRRWQLDLPGPAVQALDAWGNTLHVLTLEGDRREIHLRAFGEVETPDGPQVPEPDGDLPPQVFLRATPLTTPDAAIQAFLAPLATAIRARPEAGLMQLIDALLVHMPYIQGSTDAATPAAQAFASRLGVCQDHAQVFVACARLLGLPARYVSGYLATDAEHVASHAWAEVRLPEGWVAFDISNQCRADGRYVRLAFGADYLDASPVRGMRTGGGLEQLATHVRVTAAADDQ
jgi:transglutaminase-like putative cysteine protease